VDAVNCRKLACIRTQAATAMLKIRDICIMSGPVCPDIRRYLREPRISDSEL
jgi:hypothetical protein